MGRGIVEMRGWETWSVDAMGVGVRWSARPVGAAVAVITGKHHLDELEGAINEYERDIDTHIRDARTKLDSLPENRKGERGVQEALISALADLIRKRAMESQ